MPDAHFAGSLQEAVALAALGPDADPRIARAVQTAAADAAGHGALDLQRLAAEVGARLRWSPGERARRVSAAGEWADRALRAAEARGLAPISRWDDRYPPLLRMIPDPPLVLWARGAFEALHLPAVAIVGARRASPTGIRVATELAAGIGRLGVTVVSGLALGIDAAAHAGTLDAGGTTVAVLGSGVDVIYPASHRPLADRVAERGAVVSEFLPGVGPQPHHFPQRNRVISGLSRAVVVIEASDRSGSLITARLALEQGREVFAVPGNVLSGQSRGCHALIKDGAALVENLSDLLAGLGWSPGPPSGQQGIMAKNPSWISNLEAMMAPGEPYSLDDLVRESGRSAGDVLAELGALELSGRVTRAAGGHFLRLDGRWYE